MIRRTAAAALAAAMLVTAGTAVPASAGDDEKIRRGGCSGSADWKMKVKTDDGRLEVEAEVDSNVSGQTWRWRISHNGSVSARGRRTTGGPSGLLRRRAADVQPGRDRHLPAPRHVTTARCVAARSAGDTLRDSPARTARTTYPRSACGLTRTGGSGEEPGRPVPGRRAPPVRRAGRHQRPADRPGGRGGGARRRPQHDVRAGALGRRALARPRAWCRATPVRSTGSTARCSTGCSSTTYGGSRSGPATGPSSGRTRPS